MTEIRREDTSRKNLRGDFLNTTQSFSSFFAARSVFFSPVSSSRVDLILPLV